MKKLSILLIALLLSFKSNAGCDTCIQASVDTTKETIKASMDVFSDALKELKGAIESMDDTISSSTDTLDATLTTYNTSIQQKLDQVNKGVSSHFELMNATLATATDQNMADIESLFAALNEQDSSLTSNMYFGEQSIPRSLIELAEQSSVLPQANQLREEFINTKTSAFNGWVEGFGFKWLATKVNRDGRAKFLKDNSYLSNVISEPVIDLSTATKMAELYKHLLAPEPLNEAITGIGEERIKNEIYRNKTLLKQKTAYNSFILKLADKIPIVDKSRFANEEVGGWDVIPSIVDESGVEWTSLEALRTYNTTAMLNSNLWVDDITSKFHTAALREQAIQTIRQNQLLQKLIENEERALLMEIINQL